MSHAHAYIQTHKESQRVENVSYEKLYMHLIFCTNIILSFNSFFYIYMISLKFLMSVGYLLEDRKRGYFQRKCLT